MRVQGHVMRKAADRPAGPFLALCGAQSRQFARNLIVAQAKPSNLLPQIKKFFFKRMFGHELSPILNGLSSACRPSVNTAWMATPTLMVGGQPDLPGVLAFGRTAASCYPDRREEPRVSRKAYPMMRPANSPLSPEAAHALDLFFATEAAGVNAVEVRRAREARFARFYALPDQALTAMGLTRDGLARWIFSDLLSA